MCLRLNTDQFKLPDRRTFNLFKKYTLGKANTTKLLVSPPCVGGTLELKRGVKIVSNRLAHSLTIEEVKAGKVSQGIHFYASPDTPHPRCLLLPDTYARYLSEVKKLQKKGISFERAGIFDNYTDIYVEIECHHRDFLARETRLSFGNRLECVAMQITPTRLYSPAVFLTEQQFNSLRKFYKK